MQDETVTPERDFDVPDEPQVRTEGSVFDRIKERHRELQAKQFKEIDIPGYDGDLVGRYTIIDPDRAKEQARKIARLPKGEQQLMGAISQIILACDSLWVREDGELKPLDPNDPEPVGYDDRLARWFGFKADGAVAVVREVFSVGGKVNVAAIQLHAMEIGEWMGDVSPEVGANLLGE